ncbi:HaeIII family restriction endonuclease [Cohnella luojiensis]|uniref:HaeIII family restriction endonuclease n=1 Tax=Cohnella luojiensis TaxID=652876 RepID=UPI00196AAB43|nr:HaeIII family restriction endonuclease [Cohnella luojiensis]
MSQTLNGKAFEYACLKSFHNLLVRTQPVNIEASPALITARDAFDDAEINLQNKLRQAADAATRVLVRLEPQLSTPLTNVPLYLSIQSDAAGRRGDVRDVLAIRRQNDWEIGFSVKHNHNAVKHSRLSQSIDFGSEWLGIPASTEYFDEIRPFFNELVELRRARALWSEIDDKAQRFYIPILSAFINELQRLNAANPGIVPSRLMSYLLGRNDFYKIIADSSNNMTIVQGFSILGTLNRAAGTTVPMMRMPRLRLPNDIYRIYFKPESDNTIIIACDEGWEVSARIHNASSKVEPSLKFDIRLRGNPPSIFTHHEAW